MDHKVAFDMKQSQCTDNEMFSFFGVVFSIVYNKLRRLK